MKGQSFTFPDSAINEPSVRQVFEICNIGDGHLTLSGAEDLLTGEPIAFYQVNTPPSTVAANSCANVEIGLFSTHAGLYSDVLRIASDDPTGPFRVNLYGSRVAMERPLISVRDATGQTVGGSFPFPPTTAGTPVSRSFDICNTGTAPLVIHNPGTLVSGTGFTQIDLPPASEIAPDTCSPFRARFNVALPGDYVGSVSIENNATTVTSFDLTGTAN